MTNLIICYPDIPKESGALANDNYDPFAPFNIGATPRVNAQKGALSEEYQQFERSGDSLTVSYSHPSGAAANHFGILNAKTLAEGGCSSIVLRSSGQSAFTPESITGLVAWYDAGRGITKDSSNLVSQWNDISGEDNHASITGAARPTWAAHSATYNYNPALTFSGGQYLAVNSLSTYQSGTDLPLTVAVALRSLGSALDRIYFNFGNAGLSNPLMDFYQQNSSGQYQYFRRDDSGASAIQSFGTVPANVMQARTSVFSGTSIDTYINGISISSAATLNVGAITTNLATIGARRGASTSEFINAQISELIVYNNALSGADLTALNAYMVSKYITAPVYQTLNLPAETLRGSRLQHLFSAISGSSALYWWITFGTSTQSRFRHSKHLLGNYLDLGRDPIWGRSVEAISDNAQQKRRRHKYSFRWEGLTAANVASFIAEIAEQADQTCFALITKDSYDPTLLSDGMAAAYLTDYSVEALAHNTYAIQAEFEEAL